MTALALAVAWFAFRVERASSRRRDIQAARAALVAVKRGMVEGRPAGGDPYFGWGTIYFGNEYNAVTAYNAGLDAARLVEQGGSYQVFAVPSAPLERLATAGGVGDLISEETIFAANFALWRVGVFNQLVEKQTAFNVQHAAEISDDSLPAGTRKAISLAAQELNIALHLDGIGLAARPDGWFGGLTAAVNDDVARLDSMAATPWWHYSHDRHLMVVDVFVVALVVVIAILGALNLVGRNARVNERPVSPGLVRDPRCIAGAADNGDAPPWVICD